MEIEGKTVVWLTADEVQIAVRNYVRENGPPVSPCARVGGLDDLTEARHAVSVLVVHSNEEVT